MLSFTKIGIYQLIAFFTTLVVVVSMGIYSYYIYIEQEKDLIKIMKQDTQNTLYSLQNNISHLIEAYDVNQYGLLIENEMYHKNFTAIVVEDYNMAQILSETSYITGKISSKNGGFIEYDPKNKKHTELLKSCFYLQSSDIFSSTDKKIGTLSICSTDKVIKDELHTLLIKNALVGIGFSILLSSILLFILRHFAILPLSHIIETLSEKYSNGIPKNRLQEFGSYEFGHLSKKINFLLDAISLYRSKEKKVIDELKRERDRSHLYLNTAEVLLVALDIDGKVTMINRKGQELLGYTQKELLGKVWFEIGVLPEDIALNIQGVFNQLMNMQKLPTKEVEHHLISKSGKKLMFSFKTAFLYDNDKKCTGILSSAIDITQKVKTVEKLEESNKALIQSKDKLHNLLESLSVGVVVHALDTSIIMYNPIAAKILGLSDSQIKGTKAIDPLWHFIDGNRNILRSEEYPVNKIIATKRHIVNMLIGINHPNNPNTTWVYVNGFPVLDNENEITEVIINFMDITELKNKDEKLSSQYDLTQNIINAVPVRIFWKDLEGVYLGANKLFLEDTQLNSTDEILGKNDFEMPWRETDAQRYKDDDMDIINTGKPKINFEESQTDDRGNVITLLTSKVPLKDEKGIITGVLGTYVDITQQIRTENELKRQRDMLDHQAHHDALTGLPNRVLLNDRLSQSIEDAKRNKTNIALLFIDLDHFKEINDSLGHNFGDEILKTVAKRLQSIIRDEDCIARLGGDEFIIVLKNLSQVQDASLIANKILDVMSEPVIIDVNTLYISCSIGISTYPEDSKLTDDLLKFADSAMYKAKDEGRSNFQYYNSRMTELAFERVVMETSLRSALENEEFVVFYQAQVNGVTNKLIGMEALVRWQHPTMGIVSPGKFIPLAESTGLIVELDRYVMKRAMTQLSTWYKARYNPGVLAMNLAVKQLKRDDFIDTLENLMKETECKAEWLELEVTESQVMTNPDEAIKILKQINDIGIELAVDDFGTGYSSLAYLKRLPINKLKIDQVFVRDLPNDDEDAGIAKAVIALASSLNLKVIAEGVETKEQRDFLVENGCHNIQGYFYSKPVTAEEFEDILINGIS